MKIYFLLFCGLYIFTGVKHLILHGWHRYARSFHTRYSQSYRLDSVPIMIRSRLPSGDSFLRLLLQIQKFSKELNKFYNLPFLFKGTLKIFQEEKRIIFILYSTVDQFCQFINRRSCSHRLCNTAIMTAFPPPKSLLRRFKCYLMAKMTVIIVVDIFICSHICRRLH